MTSAKIKKNIGRGFLATYFLLLFLFLPMSLVFAQAPAPTEGLQGITYVCVGTDSTGKTTEVPCESFGQLIEAVKKIANFAVGIGLAFSVVVIAYAGARYIIYSDSEGERKKATEMFEKVAIGIGWILAAWLIINMIMTALASSTVQTFLK